LSPGASLLLWSLVVFEVKHFLCDFVLQTAYLYRNKGIYGHRAGFIHAGLHAGGSLPAILLLSRDSGLIAAILVVEFLIHYHVDWLKLHIDKRYRLGINQSLYWAVFGADQLLHQLTYVGILAVLANAAPESTLVCRLLVSTELLEINASATLRSGSDPEVGSMSLRILRTLADSVDCWTSTSNGQRRFHVQLSKAQP